MIGHSGDPKESIHSSTGVWNTLGNTWRQISQFHVLKMHFNSNTRPKFGVPASKCPMMNAMTYAILPNLQSSAIYKHLI